MGKTFGARGATLDSFLGPAHAHMLAADRSAGGPTVRFANAVWVDAALRLKDAYARVAAEHYRAEARPAPFKSMVSSPAIGKRLLSLPLIRRKSS
jgi:serpin B